MSRQQQPPYRRSHSTPVDRSQPPAADLYQQLIESSDLVKELDDIEAISQQISQHAEVLYQSWKNNGMTQGPGKFKLPTTTSSAPSSPMSAVPNGIMDGAAGSSSSHQQQQQYMPNGGMNSNTFPRRGYQLERNTTPDPPGPPLYQRQNGGTTDYSGGRISPEPYSRQLSQQQQQPVTSTVPRLNGSRLKPLSISSSVTPIAPSSVSGLSSPSFITSKSATLPSRVSGGSSSVTGENNFDKMDKNPDVAKSLDLLAAPEVNGSLKELVSSFVSTDRAKQAARQTIANTINNMTKRNGGFRSSSPSSSSSPFSSRAVSPLRSPSMLAAGGATTTNTNGTSGLASLTSLGGLSPSTSTLGGGPLSPTGSTTSSSNASSVLTDINGSGSRLRTLSPTRSLSESSSRFRSHSPPALPLLSQTSVHTKMPAMFNTNGDSNSVKTWNREPIPIPVHHVATNDGLRSPSVLNTLRPPSFNREPEKSSDNNKMFNSEQPPSQVVRPVQREVPAELELGRAALPIANMHLAHVDHMKKRFEEAKQRMNLIHERALLGGSSPFDRSDDLFDGGSNGIDDSSGHSSFLFDQFRRRIAAKNKQAAPPHPELTPQQRQHIYERSTPSGTALANSQQPLRRIMSGGSVAERVMIFERCPVFSPLADPAKESRVGTGGFPPGSLSLSAEKKKEATPLPITSLSWKNNANEVQVPRNKIIRDIPIAQTGLPASTSFSTASTSASATPLSLTTPLLLSASATPATTTASPTSSITPALSSTTTPTPTLYPVATATTTPSSLITPQSSRASSLASLSPPASAISSRVPSPQPKSRPASLVITAKDKVLPKFHFPYGDPSMSLSSETPLTKFSEEFRRFKNSSVSIEELGQILKACGYPVYWKGVVFVAAGGEKAESLTFTMFAEFWRRLMNSHHDEASQFVFVLAKGNSAKRSLTPEDFVPLIQDIVDTHPGLGFLKEATEFHSRYVHTVIARIFFVVNRSWSGRITIPELRRSNFLATLRILDQEEDINQISDFFSYEHFYVIYCKFWELDKDHDLFIDREDLARHNDHAISTRMIDRIFSGAVTRGTAQTEGKMSYTEFVWFLLAEEDKRSPTSIEYWFRCMDLDGDGFLSMYELEYFYEEQLQRMEQLGIETLPFEDCLCQMLDMIGPKERTKICLADLKGCRMTPIFFDTFFNLEKYLDHEQRDPFASQHDVDEDGNEMSDWDRFAAEEYELLVAEEGNAEGMDDMCYDDENNPEMQLDQALENEMMYREPLMAGGGSSS